LFKKKISEIDRSTPPRKQIKEKNLNNEQTYPKSSL